MKQSDVPVDVVVVRMAPFIEPELNSGCHLWSGGVGAGGYGTLCIFGVVGKAHRWAFMVSRGFMPTIDQKVCHKCDTPACVNPDHLFLGSQADNVRDMMEKGRHRVVPQVGSNNPMAALTEQKVWEIRRCAEMGAWTQKQIADSYGVSPMAVSRIINFESWQHVHRDWPSRAVPHTYGNVWYSAA